MKTLLYSLCTLVFLALLRVSPALAFQFQPMGQVFAPVGNNATRSYQVVNNQANRIAVELTVVGRSMALDGEETYHPADDDFLIFPAQMILDPGDIQVVRVSWLGDPAPEQELAFRIIAEQLPIQFLDPTQTEPTRPVGQVRVMMRYIGSLFVRPEGARAEVSVESVAAQTDDQGAPMVALTLHNAGNASAQLRDLTLTLTAQGQAVTLTASDLETMAGTSVLPGHRRRYVIPWPADLPQSTTPTATFTYRQD